MKKLKKIIKEIYNYIILNCKDFIKDLRSIKKIRINEILKKKSCISAIILSLITVFVFISYINFSKSKEDVIEGFKNALINGNSKQLCKYIKVNEEKVSAKELEPLIEYYSGKESKIKIIENSLKQNGESGNFVLENKKGILTDEYYISINTVEVSFVTDTKNVDVQIEDKSFELIDKAKFDVIPGSYNINYNYNTEYGDITENMTIDLIDNKIIEIKVNGNYITLYSNFDDAKVFINNIDTNLIAKDIKNYGPIPKNKEILIQLEREFPWGTIKSKSVDISNQQYLKLDINMVNDELMTLISELVNEFYSSSFDALNNRDKELIVNSTIEVKDKIYNYINEKTLLFSNNYEITDLKVQIEKSDFKYEDENYKASLVTKINYHVSKKILPFIKTANESSFILNLEYSNDTFVINGIQKINL